MSHPTLKFVIPRHGDPKFAVVGAAIAKGPPPEWLVPTLTYFSGFIHDASQNC